MTSNLSPPGKIVNGKFVTENRDFLKWDLESLEGKMVELTVKEVKNQRSLDQNAYYWGVVIKSVVAAFNEEQTFNRNMTAQATHEFLKAKFLGSHRVIFKSEVVDVPNTSKSLTTKGFSDYIENIIAFASEFFNVKIPEATQNT
jgi:hypothetical protein